MSKILFVLASLSLSSLSVATAHADFTGEWVGSYDCRECVDSPVQFAATLSQFDNRIYGAIVERDRWGSTSPYLVATVTGSYDPATGILEFKKSYDGTGGFAEVHSYSGMLNGVALSGIWKNKNEATFFRMVPVSHR